MDKVISLEENRIVYGHINSKPVVFKKTSFKEKENILKAKSFLKHKYIMINNKEFCISVPDIYLWNANENTLCMSYCNGQNLEMLLRDPICRTKAIPFLQSMFRFILKEHFYWEDFAPRNIILNSNNIYLVDFEKSLSFSENKNVKEYLRNHVFEEYSSFLLPEERLITAEQVFSPSTSEISERIKVSDIKYKRIKYIALALGFNDFITKETYLNIQKMIIKAEEPYVLNNCIFFPRIQLTKMLENKNADPSVFVPYAITILAKNKLSPLNEKERE